MNPIFVMVADNNGNVGWVKGPGDCPIPHAITALELLKVQLLSRLSSGEGPVESGIQQADEGLLNLLKKRGGNNGR